MARILIPARFERVAAAFDADVAARMGLCESSGSEHSLVSSIDLSDMVKSFLERNGEEKDHGKMGDEEEKVQTSSQLSYCEKRDMLQALLACGDYERDMIRREAEIACAVVGVTSSTDFKRKLMSRLRKNGLDAGLCKSRWEKTGRLKSGDYEYIDVNFSGERYIVEVFLASEFEIARPTIQYSSLLQVFQRIFVGKVEELKQVVKLMCSAIKGSMKTRDLHVAPWRRNVYMEAKWFSSYKRTTNAVSTRNASSSSSSSSDSLFLERFIGFEPRPIIKAHNCRDYHADKTRLRIGHLTSTFE